MKKDRKKGWRKNGRADKSIELHMKVESQSQREMNLFGHRAYA